MSNTENNYIATDLGNIALNLRGEYDESASYEYLDTVSYKGGSYVCLAELAKTISRIAPAQGKNTDMWQMIASPGDMTPEYLAARDEVLNKAKQVEISRAVVELSQTEVEAAQADVQQMRQDTQEAAEEAIASRDSAAGYAQAAEVSRTATKESEDNINALITGFDTRVTGKTSEAETAIAEARQTAVNTVSTKQDDAVQAVTNESNKQIKNVEDAGAEQISKIETTGKSAVSAVGTAGQSAINAIETQQTASVEAITGEGTKQVGAVNTAGEEQNVKVSTTAAEELIKLQKIAAQFENDHEQIGINKENINRKAQVWTPNKTENASIDAKEVSLRDIAGNAILDLSGNEIRITAEAITPVPPYQIGDLWVSGDVIYVCTSAKTEGNFSDFDWMKVVERG